MRTRLFLLLVFATAFIPMNAVAQGEIAYGVRVVVLDAGHGGRFPGTMHSGVKEKDLALKIILRVGALIEEGMPGVKVVYTRKTDKEFSSDLTVDLQSRADIANRASGDLFVSVHVNAARNSSAKGVETLIMGESSKEQSYNESALFNNNREDLIDMSDERTAAIVRAYIQNLQFTYGEYSMAMARCIQENYRRDGRTMRSIKPQLLRVLYATDMPGVLTEIGFLSNPQEAAYMKSERGQEEIAQSLYRSVNEYSNYVLAVRGGVGVAASPATTDGQAEEVNGVEAQPAPTKNTEPTVAKPAEKVKAEQPAAKAKGKVRYAIQVMASPKVVSLTSSSFKSYKGKVKQYAAEGTYRYKYCVGECATEREAQTQLARVKKVFPQAFVVKCQGGRIVK